MTAAGRAGFLAPYRVLDLTDHRGLLAGHMFAQLGADVVQLEPPGGSPGRRQPPFAPEWPDGENSLYWAAYASGKRSLVCDPDTPGGLDVFRALVARADFLFESAAPRDGRPAWLAPDYLRAVNPALVHVTLTPFGLTGPKADWPDSEITLWAAGGPLLPTRGPEDRPLRISAPQGWLHAAGDAAGGALVAHFSRAASGEGQHVEVSALQSIPQATLSAILAAGVGHVDYTGRPGRPGTGPGGGVVYRSKWPVSDGLAEMHVAGGPISGASTNQMFAWMREAGAIEPHRFDWDWVTIAPRIASGEISEAEVEAARAAVAAFIAPLRKAELMEIAMRRGIRVAPVQTIADLLADQHLGERGFFQTLHGPFGDYVLPGDFALGAPGGFTPLTPAPRLGEHTAAVLSDWLGGDAA